MLSSCSCCSSCLLLSVSLLRTTNMVLFRLFWRLEVVEPHECTGFQILRRRHLCFMAIENIASLCYSSASSARADSERALTTCESRRVKQRSTSTRYKRSELDMESSDIAYAVHAPHLLTPNSHSHSSPPTIQDEVLRHCFHPRPPHGNGLCSPTRCFR
jgi:hypothetical protein